MGKVWNEIKYIGEEILEAPDKLVDWEADFADKTHFDPLRFAGGRDLRTGEYTPVNRTVEKIMFNLGLIWAVPELTPMVGEFLIAQGVPAGLVVGAGVLQKLRSVVGRVELLGMIAKNLGYSGIEAKNIIKIYQTVQLLVRNIQKDESISKKVKETVKTIVSKDPTGVVDAYFGISEWASKGSPGFYTGVQETAEKPLETMNVKEPLHSYYTLANYNGAIDYTGGNVGQQAISYLGTNFIRSIVKN